MLVPPSYGKFISVMRIFSVQWKVHNKFIMKWKRRLFSYYIYSLFCGFFSIKVCRFSINVKVKFHSNIQKQNFTRYFTHNKIIFQFWSKTCFFYDIMPLIISSLWRLWTLNELYIWVTITKFRTDEIYLFKKNIVFTFIMLRGTQHSYNQGLPFWIT